MVTGAKCSRLRFGVRCLNQSLRIGVPNRGLEILYLAVADAVNGRAHALVLCAYFTADGKERTSEDGSTRLLKIGHTVLHITKVAIEPSEIENCWRKKSVHVRPTFVPF